MQIGWYTVNKKCAVQVMSVWPFRSMVMRASKRAAAAEANTAQGSLPEQPLGASIPECVASGATHAAHQTPDAQQAKQNDISPDAAGNHCRIGLSAFALCYDTLHTCVKAPYSCRIKHNRHKNFDASLVLAGKLTLN